jgi:plastocyanin
MRIGSSSILSATVATLTIAYATAHLACAQQLLDVTARLEMPSPHTKADSRNAIDRPPAVIWLTPVGNPHTPARDAPRTYTLRQKNKQFSPHVLVVPVGSVVQFPNDDPFFHNVFSLFDGRRFDLGLYEAGSTRGVTFGKEGVSYIFCNIHPEMSAVVLALFTPFYAVEEPHRTFRLQNVPAGDYLLQVWVQGADPVDLKALERRVHISTGHSDLGAITLSAPPHPSSSHTNKYGKEYDTREPSIY